MREESLFSSRLEQCYRVLTRRIDWMWIIILLIFSVLILTINLDNLPLRDWDEATVALVARGIRRAPLDSLRWLFPLLDGNAYHNKPPLMHWLIAIMYTRFQESEWTTRFPGAILTAVSVPLLYCIGREIFHQRWAALYSALVYVTMLPVIRHGRLAMLDSASVCFFMVMLLCALRSRRDLRYCLGVGIGFGLICLTKGMLGILLGAIAFGFLWWDTPRLLVNPYMWLAICLGLLPVGSWYTAQFLHYGQQFTQVGIIDQSLSRIWTGVERNGEPVWYYALELLKYLWPWLIFLPTSVKLMWENRNLSWAKLALVWTCGYFITISVMTTKLPWYLYPIYPGIALILGSQLAQIHQTPLLSKYPRLWRIGLGFLAVVATAGSIYYSFASSSSDLQLILAVVAGTMALSGILAERGDGQFIQVLLWGSYLSLFLLMKSNYWVWELNEHYPVKPVAQMLSTSTLSQAKIYTSFPFHRPSLNFYSDRVVIPASPAEIQNYWQFQSQSFFLLQESDLQKLKLNAVRRLAHTDKWILVAKDTNRL